VTKIFLLFYMCHFAMGLTHCYKTTVFLTFIINEAIDHWQTQLLRTCVKEEGRHFEPQLHAGPHFATRPAGPSIKRKNHKMPSHEHRVAFQIPMKSFSTYPTSQMNAVSPRMLRFSRAIVHRQYLAQTFRWDETPRSTTEYTDECLPIMPALSQTINLLF